MASGSDWLRSTGGVSGASSAADRRGGYIQMAPKPQTGSSAPYSAGTVIQQDVAQLSSRLDRVSSESGVQSVISALEAKDKTITAQIEAIDRGQSSESRSALTTARRQTRQLMTRAKEKLSTVSRGKGGAPVSFSRDNSRRFPGVTYRKRTTR